MRLFTDLRTAIRDNTWSCAGRSRSEISKSFSNAGTVTSATAVSGPAPLTLNRWKSSSFVTNRQSRSCASCQTATSAKPPAPTCRTCNEPGKTSGAAGRAPRRVARRRASARVQAAEIPTVRRSRSAAYARQARMSSRVSCGNSSVNCCSDMPPARYPSTSPTVMRVPRTHGFPNGFPDQR